jgi:vacuolar-type H+-ATPase subunit C/Vma6
VVDDFNYLNARIRGMRGELLDDADFLTLTASRDLGAMLSLLRATAYGPPLQSALTRTPGIGGAEEGLRESLSGTFASLSRIASGESGDLVDAAVGRWESQCVKTILRGKYRHLPPEEIISASLPAGFIDDVSLRELAHLENTADVIDVLHLWRYPAAAALRRAWKRRATEGDIQRLEYVLDQGTIDSSLARLDRAGRTGDALRDFLLLEIDLTNALTALRLAQARSPSTRRGRGFFLTGGLRLSRDRFTDLTHRESAAAAVGGLKPTGLGGIFESSLDEYRSAGRLSLFEKAARGRLRLQALRATRFDPLGIGLAVGYLWLKAEEVADLRLLCRAAHIGLPPHRVEEELSRTLH